MKGNTLSLGYSFLPGTQPLLVPSPVINAINAMLVSSGMMFFAISAASRKLLPYLTI